MWIKDDLEPSNWMELYKPGVFVSMTDEETPRTPRGCPECDWDGKTAVTHDHDHVYHTHIIVKDGETFMGSTCSRRTKPRKNLFQRLLSL